MAWELRFWKNDSHKTYRLPVFRCIPWAPRSIWNRWCDAVSDHVSAIHILLADEDLSCRMLRLLFSDFYLANSLSTSSGGRKGQIKIPRIRHSDTNSMHSNSPKTNLSISEPSIAAISHQSSHSLHEYFNIQSKQFTQMTQSRKYSVSTSIEIESASRFTNICLARSTL